MNSPALAEVIPPESNALAVITEKNAVTFFAEKGLDPVLEKIRQEVAAFKGDISSEAGRTEIKSFVYKLKKMKNGMDKLGKDLVSGIKAQAKIIDAERSRAWDQIEKWEEETRMALTEWEQKDEKRVAEHKNALAQIEGLLIFPLNPKSEEIAERIKSLSQHDGRNWDEFTELASTSTASVKQGLWAKLDQLKKAEADAIELDRLRKEKELRDREEREERIRSEAAAKAKLDAETEAARKAGAEAERARQEQARQNAENDRLKREKEESDARAAKAEEDAKKATERERERVAEEQRKLEAEAKAREKDKTHKSKVNGEAVADLMKTGLSEETCKVIIRQIVKGEVRNVSIKY